MKETSDRLENQSKPSDYLRMMPPASKLEELTKLAFGKLLNPATITADQFEVSASIALGSGKIDLADFKLLQLFAKIHPYQALELLPEKILLENLTEQTLPLIETIQAGTNSRLFTRFYSTITFVNFSEPLKRYIQTNVELLSPELLLQLIPVTQNISPENAFKDISDWRSNMFYSSVARRHVPDVVIKILSYLKYAKSTHAEFWADFEYIAYILSDLFHDTNFEDLNSFLPIEIDFGQIDGNGSFLISQLITKYAKQFLQSHTFIDKESLLYFEHHNPIVRSISKVNGDIIQAFQPSGSIDWSRISRGSCDLIPPPTTDSKHLDEMFWENALPEILDLTMIGYGEGQLLSLLIKRLGKFNLVEKALSTKPNFSSISDGGLYLLATCYSESQQISIYLSKFLHGFKSFPNTEDDWILSLGLVLHEMVIHDQESMVVSFFIESLPELAQPPDWRQLCQLFKQTFPYLSTQKQQTIVSHISNGSFIEDAFSDEEGIPLLTMFAHSEFADQFPLLPKLMKESCFRIPISPDKLTLKVKCGPHLHEQIEKFPHAQFVTKLTGGWYYSRVNKPFDVTRIGIFFRPGGSPMLSSLIFRLNNLPENSLTVYRQVASKIPYFIGLANYPELTESHKPLTSIKGDSFREVYQGHSIYSIDEGLMQNEIRSSIRNQKKQIIFLLDYYGIQHNHTHDGNFNVRYLLSSEDGTTRKLSFDVNDAIRTAITENLNLTPIVVIRDWDLASITPDPVTFESPHT